jgi:hypothetical protein
MKQEQPWTMVSKNIVYMKQQSRLGKYIHIKLDDSLCFQEKEPNMSWSYMSMMTMP